MNKNIPVFFATICYIVLNFVSAASLFAESSRITSPYEYKQKYYNSRYRIVHLPSGATFEVGDIGKEDLLGLLKKHSVSISNYNNMISDEHSNGITLSGKNKFAPFLHELIIKSVKQPILSMDNEEGKLQVTMLSPADFNFLCKEIGQDSKGILGSQVKHDLAKMNSTLTITDLILSSKRYEGERIDIKGVVTHEMKEIIISGGERKIILQRFYLSDGLNAILVFWFCKDNERLELKPGSMSKFFGSDIDPNTWQVKISRGEFTTTLIQKPVIIGYSRSLHAIKDLWISKIHETLTDYR